MTNFLKSKTAKAAVGLIALVLFFGSFASNAFAAFGDHTLRAKSSWKEEVKVLQAGLNEKGFASPALVVDGAFGPKTTTAVKAYQANNGLVADGLFGPKSFAKWGTTTGGTNTGSNSNCQPGWAFDPVTGVACGTGNSGQSGPVTAMVATTNPASTVFVASQATADLARFTFTGSGTVTNVTLKRIGISADATLSNVYLFDGATRLTDASSVSNNGQISFNIPAGIFTVSGTKTITVRSDIAAGSSGQTVGVTLQSFTTSSSPVVTANISGNIHSIASASLATVGAGTVTPSGATLNPGSGVTVWQSTLSIGNRDVLLKRLALRNVGSAPASAFQNFKLFVNGTQVATAAGMDAMGYVTFDTSAAPVSLASGSRVVRVDADIVSGASRTVQFSLRQAADVDFVDSSFGVNVSPTSTPWAAAAASTVSGASGGSLTIEKDVASPSGNVSEGTSDQVIGIFKVTAYGEPMKIENLRATFTSSDASVSELRNGRIMIGGVQYGSTATLNEDSHSGTAYTQFTTNYTVMPGTPVMVELRADMYDNDGTDNLTNGDTIAGVIAVGSSNVMKVDSLGSVSAPAAAVSANTLTVADASMTLSKNGNYANQTVVLPSTATKIGSWNLAGSSTEDVLLTTLSFDVDEVSGTEFDEGDLTNMYVVVKNGSTVVAQPSPLATVSATANNFPVNYTLVKNSSVSIELFANMTDDGLDSTIDSGDSFNTNLTVSGTAMISGSAVCADDDNVCDNTTGDSTGVDGQTIAYGSASITATKDASSADPVILVDNQSVVAAAFKFDAITSGYNVTDLTFTLANTTVAQTFELYDGTTLIGSKPGSASPISFSGLSWNIPANTNKVLTVKLVLGSIGVGAGTSGASQLVTLTDFKATNTSTGVNAAGTESDPAGSAMYAYAATPTITRGTLPSTVLSTGTQTIAKFSVASNGGTIGWKKMIFTVSRAIGGTDTLSNTKLYDADTNVEVAGTATYSGGIEADGGTSGTIIFVATNEQQISGSKNYVLKTDIAGTLATGNNINVSIAQPSSYAAPAAYATVAATSASFVWSDVSASSHSTSTTDWSNDYLVKTLPTDTQTLIFN